MLLSLALMLRFLLRLAPDKLEDDLEHTSVALSLLSVALLDTPQICLIGSNYESDAVDE